MVGAMYGGVDDVMVVMVVLGGVVEAAGLVMTAEVTVADVS